MTDTVFPCIHVVDDDEALRDSLCWLLESAGHRVKTYVNAEMFLASYAAEQGGCLLLDIRMPGMSGLELQEELNRRGHAIPIIFITGHGDVRIAVNAIKKGALEFFEKPFNGQTLLVEIDGVLALETGARRGVADLARLTSREREIVERVVAGKRNQDVAAELSISIKTVEFHRANVMRKMGANSLPDLVQLVSRAGARGRR